jgi:AcrR family transcriptional regulator
MAPQRAARLTPETIVDAAVRIAARADPAGLSGRAIGAELGVDRSAVWRHFADQDALLLAVGDRFLQMAVDRVPDDSGPAQRLRALAVGVVEVFEQHPFVGAQLASRFTHSHGEFAGTEMILQSLEALGLDDDDVARFERIVADTVLAYAGMRAVNATLSSRARERQALAYKASYAAADEDRYPALNKHLERLSRQKDDEVFAGLLDALEMAIMHAATRTTR